jgi:hypothetical protein
MRSSHLVSIGLVVCATSATSVARADSAGDTAIELPAQTPANDASPIAVYTYRAGGAAAHTVGASAHGVALSSSGQKTTAGGGLTAWGSPVDRLTLVLDARRDVYLLDHFSPSLAAVVRLLGSPVDGWSLGALAKYKVEGFGTDPNGDTESEIESGLLVSFARRGWHLDLNAIAGAGLTDEGEIDTEGRLRFGYDASEAVRVGADGQARWRLAGTGTLPGGRTWDFAAGPQIAIGSGHFFGLLTAGPTTMGITRAGVVGWNGIATFGATM